MAGLIGSNYLRADKVPDHVINYIPEPEEYSGAGSDALLDLKARALIQHARGLGNKDVDSVQRYIDSLDTLEDPSAMEIQNRASSYFNRRRMSYEDQVTLDTLLSGGDFLDALAASLGATREETVEYLDEINSRRTGEPGQMKEVPVDGYLALPLAKNAAGIYSDRKTPVREYGRYTQDSAQSSFNRRSYAVSSGALGFLMRPGAAAEELLWHPPNTAVMTPEESRLQLSRDRASSATPGGYEAFSPNEFARALSSVKHSLIRGLRKQDPSLTLLQAELRSNALMIPMLEERSELIRVPSGAPGREAKQTSLEKRFPLDRENSDQLTEVLRVYDGENNGTFERIRKKDERLADMWREAVRAVKQRFESGAYPEQIVSVSRQAAESRAASKGGDASGSETAISETPVSEALQNPGGPRIVINPTTFRNSKDALCTAFNEGFRIWMEANDFHPQSEPTDAQRKFFSDTAYADDEVQLRRTILARIATFDTSVKDPTDDQLAETGAFLDAILESDWCKNEWERNCVARLSEAVKASVGAEPVEPRPEPIEPREPEPLQSRAALGGGEAEDEQTRRQNAIQFAEERGMSTEGFEDMDIQTVESVYTMHDEQVHGMAMAEPSPEEQTGQAQPQNPQQGASQEPGNPGQPEEPAQQDAQGEAQEPTGSQGDAQPGNEQAKPQNAPQGQEEASQPGRQGAWSNVWTGGEEGKGRQLTAREAEWMKQRIDSGASVSGRQLSMFGLQRNERGAVVDSAGNAFNGFGKEEEEEKKPLPGSADAKVDDRERKRRRV